MRQILILGFFFTLFLLIANNSSAEPEVTYVSVDPASVDKDSDDSVTFEGDCDFCTQEELQYFYWNSSIDEIIHYGDSFDGLNFVKDASEFTGGEHEITLQVKGGGEWSLIDAESTTNLVVNDKSGGIDKELEANFDILPPIFHLGETAVFQACTKMQPMAQPCDDEDADLSFTWTIQLEGTENSEVISNAESFEYSSFSVGNYTLSFVVTNNDNDEEASGSKSFQVLPPRPIASVVEGLQEIIIKKGYSVSLNATCKDYLGEPFNCKYTWDYGLAQDYDDVSDIWKEGHSGVVTVQGSVLDFQVDDSFNVGEYIIRLIAFDEETNTPSISIIVKLTINPANVIPTPEFVISIGTLGGGDYYKYSLISFNSTASYDGDGVIIARQWWVNNQVLSTDEVWKTSFDTVGKTQIKFRVQDDDGVWSPKISKVIDIIDNTPPSVNFTISSEGKLYNFSSTVSDAEGHIVSLEWKINGVLISTDETTTWEANSSGDFLVLFIATDDGGLSSNLTKTFTVKSTEPKNFVVEHAAKIDVGENLRLDFSKTTGDVSSFEIVVYFPDGNSEKFEVNRGAMENTNIGIGDEFEYKCELEGEYVIDVTVKWSDGSDFNKTTDYYTFQINVGDKQSAGPEPGSNETLPLDEDTLPSISLFTAILSVTIMALARRQR